MQCVVLAGGLATRMRPLTEKIPKALIPVCGQPFIFHQLEWLSKTGVTDVVLSLGFLGELVQKAVGDGTRWKIKIHYVHEGKELRGTAGALRLCLDAGVLEDAFLVTYGDSFLPIDFSSLWYAFQAQKLPAMMSVFRNDGKWDASNVWFQEGRVRLYDKFGKHPEHKEKLQYIDYGLSVFQSSVINEMVPPSKKADLADIFYSLSRNDQLAGYEVNQRFYEIGSPQGLEDFSQFKQLSNQDKMF